MSWTLAKFGALAAATTLAGSGAAMAHGKPTAPKHPMPPMHWHHPGPGRHGHGPGFMGKVTSVGSNQFTMQSRGKTVTVDVTSSTKIGVGPGIQGQFANITKGERVAVNGSESGSTVTAKRIELMLPSVRGKVTAINGDQVAIIQGSGRTATIALSQAPSVQVGQEVIGVGSWQQDTLNAQFLQVAPVAIHGVITNISGSQVTVRHGNKTTTFTWNSSTKFFGGPKTTVTGSSLKTGERIMAMGIPNGSTLVANRVDIPPAHKAQLKHKA